MKTVLQRVESARCTANHQLVGDISKGLVMFVGIEEGDDRTQAESLVDEIVNLRIFEDEDGDMNRSLKDVDGEILVVPNFTLCADTGKGHRPSFNRAAPPDQAEALVDYIEELLRDRVEVTESGEFGAMMTVNVENDGPVTIVLDH